jgi:Fe-S cluster assembly protein SufD
MIASGTDLYLSAFEQLERDAAAAPAWLRDLRRAGIDRFSAVGFPTTKNEEWKHTSVAPIAGTAFELAANGAARVSSADIAAFDLGDAVAARVVFVNGRFAPALSAARELPSGAVVSSLAAALKGEPGRIEGLLGRLARHENSAFTALNTAFVSDGAFVSIPAHAVVEGVIHLLFLSSAGSQATVSHPRVLIVAGENSQLRLVESYEGIHGGRSFTNAVTEIMVGQNAVVDHYKLQRELVDAYHVAAMHVKTVRGSTFSSHSLAFGGAIVRNDVTVVLAGEGGDCTVNGLYLSDAQRLVDNHTTIDHAMPHCDSHEIYKGILGGRARGVFNGKIIVRPDAQKTDAKQTNKALLLSDEATINTKPQLEIFADDVKCTHGATVGQLEEDAIFYLRSRGLSYQDARDILIHAFAGDILNRVRIEPLKAQLEATLQSSLALHPVADGS